MLLASTESQVLMEFICNSEFGVRALLKKKKRQRQKSLVFPPAHCSSAATEEAKETVSLLWHKINTADDDSSPIP